MKLLIIIKKILCEKVAQNVTIHLLAKDLKIHGSSFSPAICKLKTSF